MMQQPLGFALGKWKSKRASHLSLSCCIMAVYTGGALRSPKGMTLNVYFFLSGPKMQVCNNQLGAQRFDGTQSKCQD